MRFSLIALPALAATVSAAAISSDAVTTEAPAPTDGPYTYSNTDAARSSAVSEFEAKSPAAAATTTAGSSTVLVTGAPVVTESPKPTSKKAAATTKKGKKPKTTTTTTTTTKKKPAATKKNGKPKATPVKKKTNTKRQNIADCAAMPKFYNYSPSQAYNTTKAILNGYMADSTFTAASVAAAPPNSRYRWLWQGLFASAGAPYYVGAQSLPSYNVTACAAICDSSPGCRSFVLYYERTPSVAPAAACPNPTAITDVRCAMWDYLLTPAMATNYGSWQNEFAKVITGSNAYTKG